MINNKRISLVVAVTLFCFLFALSSVQAGTIATTNLNSTYTTNDDDSVEMGLQQTLQFNGTNFTEYANQEIVLNVLLENGSAWWDKTNQQWDFPVTVDVDSEGNFSYNWFLPYNEMVWPNATGNVSIGAGQYVMPGLQNVAIANKSVLGGLFWVKRDNSTLAQQAIWGDSQKIYTGSTGIVTAFNKSYNGNFQNYYGNSNGSWVWKTILATTGIVQEVWAEPDGTYVYTVQTTAGWLRKLNSTNGTVITSVDGAGTAEKYSIWGDSNYIYAGLEAGVDVRNYTKDLSAYSSFTDTPAISSHTYDIWTDNQTLYACYVTGHIYAYNLTNLQTLWTNQSNLGQPCWGIFGDNDSVYAGYANGILAKWNKTNGELIWAAQDYTYSATPAAITTINNIWVNTDYVYALYSDGRVLYFNKTNGASALFRLYPYHVTGLLTTLGNAIYGDEDYIYTAHNLGWIFKYGQENNNLEFHPEANFWIRDLADTWNFILKPTKSIFSDNETLAFEFMAFDNKTNPVDVSAANLQGTYFWTRTSSNYNAWQAATYSKLTFDPRIQTAALGITQYTFYNNFTYGNCPATHYQISGFYANKTGWFLTNGGGWCLYNTADVPPPVYSTLNATKPLSTYILATVVPKPMINSTNAAWYNILNGNYSNNPYENITKYYGHDKYTWFAVFGSNPTTLGAAAPIQPLNSGVVGVVKKAGSDYEYSWADKFGRSDYWNPATKLMITRYSLAQNETPFEMYWVFADTTGSGSTPYIASAIEKTTIAIANPINITIQEDEYNADGWTVDGYLFYHKRNITYIEPNIIERVDEPINFSIDPLENISSDCRDIRIVDDSSNLVIFQNETCSSNSVNLWHFINLTQGENKNFSVYYNSTASSPSFIPMDVTTSGTCVTQTVNLNQMNLAYDTNYTKSYNWTGWGLDAVELLKFNFGNTTSWVVATSVQDLGWAYNNGTTATAVDGWNQRCMQQTGPIFTKMSMNQTAMVVIGGVNLDIFGTVYVFQKSGRVKMIMQPSSNATDSRDGYPAFFRYGLDSISPQGKSIANDFIHVWTDWAGRREGLDKTVLGEPLVEYTNYTVNGAETPLKVTLRFPFPDSFNFNYNASTPTCMGNQLMNFFNYTNNTLPSSLSIASIAAAWMWDFGICHRDIVKNMTQYDAGWSMIYPDLRIYGNTWNKWVDLTPTTGPYTYARFYLFQNNFTPFTRENRFYPYMGTKYTVARETLVPVDMCPDVEHGYNDYSEMLNNITKTTIDQERKTSGNYDCLMNLAKLTDANGADKAEFVLMKNASVFSGEARRNDELYPTTITNGIYTQTTANKVLYWYGNWFATITPQPYVIHGYSTSGNPQFQDYVNYYQAPQQYFNKNVWDESYFWNKNETQLLGGTGVNIGSELQNSSGFACNLVAGAVAQYGSIIRKGWAHLGTPAITCPYSIENMKHYAYAKPSYSSYISLYSTTASTAGAYRDFYIFGKNNYSEQVGTHNSLFDYLHNPDGISTDPQNIDDLNESEKHMNKQPWYCQESSKINRSFCMASVSSGSFIFSLAAGAANENVTWGQDYSSTRELDRFQFYVNTRWSGTVQYSNDYLINKIVYQFLVPGEFDLNLLYAGEGLSENKMGMVYPDASKAMTQGYLQGFDAGNRFWVYFDLDERQYSTGQTLNINGTLFKNDTRLSGAPISLIILKTDNTFVTSAVKTTDSSGKFNWTYTLPITLTSGLYYIKADYNNGEIINKFGLKITTNVLTISTDKASYSRGETATTTFNIKDYLTEEYNDPDQTELRYSSPDGSVIRCAKYPSTASVQNCDYNLIRTATGQYSDLITLSELSQLGIYLQKITTTNTGVTANFYNAFSVSEFTGWIDVSINNTIVGTSFISNIAATNTGNTQVTKTVEITIPAACGSITSITNSTEQSIIYNIQDLSSSCKVYWDVTLEGAQTTWFLIQATLPSSGSGSANPEVSVGAPAIIKTNTNFGITALTKSSSGIPVNCASVPTITIRDTLLGTNIVSGASMTNFATGQYNYTWSAENQSTFLATVVCTISGIGYTGAKEFSTQDVGTTTTMDYNQIAEYVWNYTARNLTYYNESVSESIQDCLKDGECSDWWINTTLININNTLNIINSTINQIKTNTEIILDYFNCTSANEVCTRIQNILNNATDIQSRVQSLNATQIPNLQISIDDVYNDTQYIRENILTASDLTNIQNNVTWLINNVATQENITLINQKLDVINSTINTIKSQTDCSNPSNSVLCTYLDNTNSTVNTIYSEMLTSSDLNNIQDNVTWLVNNVATSEAINDNFTDVRNRLTDMNDTLWNVNGDLIAVNLSLSNQIANLQIDITWIKDNLVTEEQINSNFTETFSRLSNINSTLVDLEDYIYINITNGLNEINQTIQSTYFYILTNVSTQTNITKILNQIDNVQSNITFIKNNMFYQGNATDAFLVDYLATVFVEPNNRVELWIATRDLIGDAKTASSADCSISRKGAFIGNATVSISAGSVYAYWDVPLNKSGGEYYWNCTLEENELNLQVPFFVSSVPNFAITSLFAASPKYPNENAIIESTFATKNGSVTPDTINLTIWKPNYLTIWYTASKNDFDVNNGIWSWAQMVEDTPTTGTYYANMKATYNGYEDSKTTQFRIATGGPYMVYIDCPDSIEVGSNLYCNVIIKDEGEAATESTTTVWLDTDNDGVRDVGETQSSFSKETQPLQNISQNVSLNIPASHDIGSFVVKASTEYLNSNQPNSNSSDSVIFKEKSEDTSGDGGNDEGGLNGGNSNDRNPSSGSSSNKQNKIKVNGNAKISKQQILTGITAQIEKDEIITFDLQSSNSKNTESHKISISEVGANNIIFVISSNPITLQLIIGEEREVDIDRDGKNDIYFKLNSITNGQADLLIEQIVSKVSSITGQTITHPEHLLDVSTRILDEYKVISPGGKVLMEITVYNLGTEEIKDLTLRYCIETLDRETVKCSEETVAVYTKLQLIKDFLISKDIKDGEYFIKTEAIYGNETAKSEISFEVKRSLFNINKEINLSSPLFIGSGILILLIIIILILVFRRRNKNKKVIIAESKLQHLDELKKKKEISKKTYHAERETLLQEIKNIFQGKTASILLFGIGLFSLIRIFTLDRNLTGYAIGGSTPINTNFLIYFIFLIGAFGLLTFIHRQEIKEKIKGTGGNYPNNSIMGLMEKKVYSEEGDILGEVKEVILETNKIDSLKIELDKKYNIDAKGIIVNYKHVKSVGEMILIDKEVIEYLGKFI